MAIEKKSKNQALVDVVVTAIDQIETHVQRRQFSPVMAEKLEALTQAGYAVVIAAERDGRMREIERDVDQSFLRKYKREG